MTSSLLVAAGKHSSGSSVSEPVTSPPTPTAFSLSIDDASVVVNGDVVLATRNEDVVPSVLDI